MVLRSQNTQTGGVLWKRRHYNIQRHWVIANSNLRMGGYVNGKKGKQYIWQVHFIILFVFVIYQYIPSLQKKITLHCSCIPSPSSKFANFPVIITLQELNLLGLVLANLPDLPSDKCPTMSFAILTQIAYLSSGLSGSCWLNKLSPMTGIQRALYT